MTADVSKVKRTRGAVDRDAIARAALAMLDEHGVDALSMRRLADRLGVGTMTLYGYFRSKGELLDAAVAAAMADREVPVLPDASLRDRLRAHFGAMRDLMERHPFLPQLRRHQPIVQPEAFRHSENGMRLLLDAGFPAEEAARTFRVLFVYVFGSMLFGPDEPSPEHLRAIKVALAGLPEDEFPAIALAAEGIAKSIGGREQFDFGLELMLDAIEARAARYSAASSHQ